MYVGQTRSRALIVRLQELGFGEMCQPTEYPPRRSPWVLDNGAYAAWKRGDTCDIEAFVSTCARALSEGLCPDFAIAPDRVAGGLESLEFSLGWLRSWRSELPGLRWYLALQDGMCEEDIRPLRGEIDGLFVGGTTEWKLRTGWGWCSLGREFGLPVHIGRVGSAKRVAWAKACGADSIDSCLPLFSAGNLRAFLVGLAQETWRW